MQAHPPLRAVRRHDGESSEIPGSTGSPRSEKVGPSQPREGSFRSVTGRRCWWSRNHTQPGCPSPPSFPCHLSVSKFLLQYS